MRVLVCGNRDFTDTMFLYNTLDLIHADKTITVVIEGEAPGADTMSRLWAEHNGVSVKRFPANWRRYGHQAGPIRNRQMLREGCPELVVAFKKPGAKSTGTNHMIAISKAAGLEVEEHFSDG